MRIREILRSKGGTVATVQPAASVRDVLAVLAEKNIGALVVSEDGSAIAGIVSERDVVRRLHESGTDVLDAPVSSIMTADVQTCSEDDDISSLRRTMTDHRIRHLPVVRDGALIGIVSIGDVVKSAISELESEREHLVEYLQS